MATQPPDDGHPSRHLPDRDLLYIEDVALFFGVTPAAIRKRVRLRQVGPWMKAGRRWAIRRSTFLRFLDELEGRDQ